MTKKLVERIEELERRVRDLEARPIYVPYYPPVSVPYWQPLPWTQPMPTTCTITATTGTQTWNKAQ